MFLISSETLTSSRAKVAEISTPSCAKLDPEHALVFSGDTVLRLNFYRLLNKCNALATSTNAGEGMSQKDVSTLAAFLIVLKDQLETIKSKRIPLKDAYSYLSSRISFLYQIVEQQKQVAGRHESLITPLLATPSEEKTSRLRTQPQGTSSLLPLSSVDSIVSVGAEAQVSNMSSSNRRYQSTAREVLLRNRKSSSSSSSSSSSEVDGKDDEKAIQEMLVDDLNSLTSSLKDNVTQIREALKQDAQVLEDMDGLVDSNSAAVKLQNKRLDAHYKAAARSNALTCCSMFAVAIIFTVTYLFIRFFPDLN
mmetsp:Transcript_49839/g.97735  ORF Transcript_49839/g.97735 Transcript_49839/m.97735 type:complete len:308 (+) Transcript_49839:17-940(+)